MTCEGVSLFPFTLSLLLKKRGGIYICGNDIKAALPQCVTQFHAGSPFVPREENAQLLPLKWAIFLAKYSFRQKKEHFLERDPHSGKKSWHHFMRPSSCFLPSVQPLIGANEQDIYIFPSALKKKGPLGMPCRPAPISSKIKTVFLVN